MTDRLTKFNYGRQIVFVYRPLADDQEVAGLELVSARLYGPNVEPSSDQLENTAAGHIGSEVTTWTHSSPGEYSITFPAVVDAAPHSTEKYDRFFVAINFRYAAAGEVKFDQETIFLYRPDGLTSKIRVTDRDVFVLEPRLKLVSQRIDVTALISEAIDDIFAKIKAKGYSKNRLFNLSDFEPACRRLACSYVCNAVGNDNNPRWAEKADRWEKKAWIMFDAVPVGYDLSGDDKPSPDEKIFSGAVAVLR